MAVEFRQATWLDLVMLVPRLRKADIDECEALYGKGTTMFVASATYRNSQMAVACDIDGVCHAMFGCGSASLLSDVGHPWMFGTDEIYRHGRSLVRDGRHYIHQMLVRYGRLSNVVDARNVKNIRWLKKLGFEIQPAISMGVEGKPFHPFVMEV